MSSTAPHHFLQHDADELEKAPAAVSVRVVRRSTGGARPKSGRSAGMKSAGARTRKQISGRAGRPATKAIAAGEPKTLKGHVARIFDDEGKRGPTTNPVDDAASDSRYAGYRESWRRVEEQIDSSLRSLVGPVCDRTLEVAGSIEASSSIPQLVPVIFHDAASLSSLDYSEYFSSSVSRFRDEGYAVVEVTPASLGLFRKSGVWSALLSLVSEQNEGLSGLEEPPRGQHLNTAVARRLLEGLCESGCRVVLAAENLEGLDKASFGELVFALSEAWDSVPVILLVGQFVKKEYIYSALPKNVLTKMYPTSVAIPGGRKMVEGLVKGVLLLGSSDVALDSDFFVGPELLSKACEILLEYQCSTRVLKRILRSALLEHVSREPLYAAVREGRSAAVPAELGGRLGLGRKADAQAVQRACEAGRRSLASRLFAFGLRVRLMDAAAAVLFNNKGAYLGLLRAGALCMARPGGAAKQIWEEGSLFDGLRKGILRGSKAQLVELVEAWASLVADAEGRGHGRAFLSDLAAGLESLKARAVVGEGSPPAPRPAHAPPPPKRQARAGSRRMALQSHVRNLSDGVDAETGLLPLQRSCADFFASLCEVPADQAPGSCALAGILLLEDAGGVVADRIAPSIPRKMVSSVRDPGAHLLYPAEGEGTPSTSLKDEEDSSVVFHFVHGFSGSLPVEEVFEQFCGAVLGTAGGGALKGKRGAKRRRAKTSPTAGGASPAQRESLNLRFERAVQELSLTGLIRISKRKMNKYVSAVFD